MRVKADQRLGQELLKFFRDTLLACTSALAGKVRREASDSAASACIDSELLAGGFAAGGFAGGLHGTTHDERHPIEKVNLIFGPL